jgi:uncharacterized membrane protein
MSLGGWHFQCVGWPWWVVVPLAGLAVWALLGVQAPELNAQPPGVRRALRWLRGAACAALLLTLLEPTLTHSRRVAEPPLVAVLVDESASMSLKDRQMHPTRRLSEAVGLGLLAPALRPAFTNATRQAESDLRLIETAGPDSAVQQGVRQLGEWTRFRRACEVVRRTLVPQFEKSARVRVFGFDEQLLPLDPTSPTNRISGKGTDLEAPLTALTRDWAQENVGAVILVTDGRQTAGRDPSPVARALRARGALVGAVLVGDPAPPSDAVVAELTGSGEVFVDESIFLDARFRVVGESGRSWDLVLAQDGHDVQRRPVRVSGDWQTERFESPARQAGTAVFQVRIEPRPAGSTNRGPVTLGGTNPATPPQKPVTWDEASASNNSAGCTVNINQDPIRVFLADATPRWESRYLSALFERDRRVKFTRRFHSVIAGDPSQTFLPKTQGAWDQFDLVVLGDLDAVELRPEQQQQVTDFVARRGGFLVCLAGPRGMPKSFSLSPLANALPVKVANQAARDSSPVTVELTEAGRDHPITQVLSDPSFNQRLWPALPPLQWIAGSVVAKAGSAVLLEAQNNVRTPVVALQRFGAGRVLWMGTSESWRWRDRLGDRVHQTFWLQAMRWGLAARLRGKDPRLQVGIDRVSFKPGEAPELRARASTARGERIADPPHLKLEAIDSRGAVAAGSAREFALTPVPDSLDIWHATLPVLAEGRWRTTVTSPHPDLRGLSEVREFSVHEQAGAEGLELSADGAALARLAAAGGHMAVGLEHAEALARDLAARLKPRVRDRARTLSLWDNYVALMLVLGCLSAEWILRKRRGLP